MGGLPAPIYDTTAGLKPCAARQGEAARYEADKTVRYGLRDQTGLTSSIRQIGPPRYIGPSDLTNAGASP